MILEGLFLAILTVSAFIIAMPLIIAVMYAVIFIISCIAAFIENIIAVIVDEIIKD